MVSSSGAGGCEGRRDTWEGAREPASLDEVDTFRLVVATAWRDAVPTITALRAYTQIIPAGAPATLVVTVPHAVGPRDTEALAVLLDHLNATPPLPSITLETFAETARRPALAALVPSGDPHILISDTGAFVTTLHHLSRGLTHPTARPRPPRAGATDGLAERFTTFAELPPIA